MFLHPQVHGHIKSTNWNIVKTAIIGIPKCASMYKNGPLKLSLLPKACLDDCYYLFTNFFQ